MCADRKRRATPCRAQAARREPATRLVIVYELGNRWIGVEVDANADVTAYGLNDDLPSVEGRFSASGALDAADVFVFDLPRLHGRAGSCRDALTVIEAEGRCAIAILGPWPSTVGELGSGLYDLLTQDEIEAYANAASATPARAMTTAHREVAPS